MLFDVICHLFFEMTFYDIFDMFGGLLFCFFHACQMDRWIVNCLFGRTASPSKDADTLATRSLQEKRCWRPMKCFGLLGDSWAL